MADARAMVGNAADPKQVGYAKRSEKSEADRQEAALRATLSTPEGRVVLWSVLEQAGVFRSVYDPGARIHYLAGRQDFGHELLARMTATRELEDLYLLMEKEAREHKRRAARGAAATQQQSIQEDSNG